MTANSSARIYVGRKRIREIVFKEAVLLYKEFGFMELKAVEKSPGHDLVFERNL